MYAQAESIENIRNRAYADDLRRYDFLKSLLVNKDILDFGCGAGGFLHLAKNGVAGGVIGIEMEKRMRDVLAGENIKCVRSIDDLNGIDFDVITMFHVLEHLPNPLEVLNELRKHIKKGGKLIVEIPNADDALLSLYNSSEFADFTYWICHLYLYSNSTFEKLIKKSDWEIEFLGQIQRYPLSNHLHWLSKGKPGGHSEWNMLNDQIMDDLYEKKLAQLGMADTIISILK